MAKYKHDGNPLLDDLCVREAEYFVAQSSTMRKTAKQFGRSSSAVCTDITIRLKNIDYDLWNKAQSVIKKNTDQRYYRGGEQTRLKYIAIRKEKRNQK